MSRDKLGAMDKVRFGRALGYGARHAAKALMNAAEAAAAEPSRAAAPASTPRNVPVVPRSVVSSRVGAVQARTSADTHSSKGPARKTAGRSLLSPLKQFSSTVLLQVMGTMFGLFAIFMAQGVWRLRGNFTGAHNTPDAHRLYLESAMFLLFAYFTVSSFVRAAKR